MALNQTPQRGGIRTHADLNAKVSELRQRPLLTDDYKPLANRVASKGMPSFSMPTQPRPRASQPAGPGGSLPSSIAQGTITTPYGGSTRFEKSHLGVDIAAAEGSPIGTAGPVTITKVNTGKSPYGNFVEGVDRSGSTIRWSHLANSWVKVGQYVGAGGKIGGMGHTGNVYSTSGGSGTHLDLRIKDLYGRYVNPMTYKYN